MEFTKAQVAALVLGYLKGEKLATAADAFLKSSPFFDGTHQNIKMGRYFVTRVAGRRLADYLEEYALIYSIVQSRLEETNFYELNNDSSRTPTLVDQILFLLDQEFSPTVTSSRPASEVDATPAHSLPGNSCSEERDASSPKTPKRKPKCRSRDEAFDISEMLTQTLNNHELHEKIAENINIARNTPESGRPVLDEHISAGASKELDAVIKTVLQKTEEDPVYNKLIDEIVGTTPEVKRVPSSSDHVQENNSEKSAEIKQCGDVVDRIDHQTNDAIRSIIEAAQITDPPPLEAPPQSESSGGVYVFDGTLDTYLKSSGATTAMNQNSVYLNSDGLFVVPPETSKSFYIVNNDIASKGTVLTENELMSIPTIIVNEESVPTVKNQFTMTTARTKAKRRQKTLIPKAREILINLDTTPKVTKRNKTTKGVAKITIPEVFMDAASQTMPCVTTSKIQATPSVTASSPQVTSSVVAVSESQSESLVTVTTTTQTTPSVTTASRPSSHIRNLDFSTPETTEAPPKKDKSAWDQDLRLLISGCKDKSPSPKRKRPLTARKKKIKPKEEEEDEVEEEEEKVVLQTPVKDRPKTPGVELVANSSFQCTPFNDVLEEQLKGVDLNLIPTPSIPITPGFALTPGDMVPYNHRSTDYSTSSSYYQPSDTEQNKSVEQLIEECRRLENLSPQAEKCTILSDVVIEEGKVPNCSDHLKKFNNNMVGKKNLSLIKRHPTSSSSSDSDSDSESVMSTELTNKTVICKKENKKTDDSAATINSIINSVHTKSILDEEERKKTLRAQLEIKRQRTVQKIKNPPEVSKKAQARNRKPSQTKATKPAAKKKNTKKKEDSPDTATDEEAQKLVKGLAQRGIHLVAKKSPQKRATSAKKPKPVKSIKSIKRVEAPVAVIEDEGRMTFDRRTYDDCELVVHEERSKRKNSKTYDFNILKKTMSTKVFCEELNAETTRVIKWTEGEVILDLKVKSKNEEINDDLMDYCIVGSIREESPEAKSQGSKGGKKRKGRFREEENSHEKKSKTHEQNLEFLKKIDVDVFLDVVHG